MLANFHFLVPESFHTKFGLEWLSISEKIGFEFLRNDLDLQYSHTFIKSFSCLYLPTFRSQASIVPKNQLFSLFPIEKPKFPNLTLP